MIGNWALLVENPLVTGRTLVSLLRVAGYRVQSETSAAAVVARLRSERCELVVVDLYAPDIDGAMIARSIWHLDPSINVILIASVAQQESRLLACAEVSHPQLIPIAVERLAERAALLRGGTPVTPGAALYPHLRPWRALHEGAGPSYGADPAGEQVADAILRVGPLIINTLCHLVTVGARQVELSSCQFNLLVYLAQRSEQVVPQQELVVNVLGYESTLHEARERIKGHIHNMRRLIEDDHASPRLLITVRGVGYKLTAG